MKIIPDQTEFEHPHICFECEDERCYKGHIEYCLECEMAHFLCMTCYPEYREHFTPRRKQDVKFSTKEKQSMR